MKLNSIEAKNNKYIISVTFKDENSEQDFLLQIVNLLKGKMQMNCMISELDVSYEYYENYFHKSHCYTIDDITQAHIFAYDVTFDEIELVISNWGFYTLDAAIALGNVDLTIQEGHSIEYLKTLPIFIQQVLDCSLLIILDECHYESFMEFMS